MPVGVGDALGLRAGQLVLHEGEHRVKRLGVVGEPAARQRGARHGPPGVGVDGHGDRDEAALAEHEAVTEGALADVTHCQPDDVHATHLDATGDRRLAVHQVDDDAVLG